MKIDSLELLCALATLSEDQREALIDTVVLERPQREIADTIGCTPHRVSNLKRQALRKLAVTLA